MKRLLVVDDEPAIGRLVQRIAETCGYAVTVTQCADQFLSALSDFDPDVIVLDLSLPDIDGVELLRLLGRANCRAKVLIMSGVDRRVLETSGRLGVARGLEIAGTIMKPARAADLKAAILALGPCAAND